MSKDCYTQLHVTQLKTEYLDNPIGIDAVEPRVSWQFVQGGRDAAQSAYQIQVADDLDRLEIGDANVWDSGRVESNRTAGIALKLPDLVSGSRYHWRVRVWDKEGVESDYSHPAEFEMGLINQCDWIAQWVSAPVGGSGYQSEIVDAEDAEKWVQVDLGESVEFGSVVLVPSHPHHWSMEVPGYGFPLRFRLEASDDPYFVDGTVLADRSQADQPNPGSASVGLSFEPVCKRYVRLTATRLHTHIGRQMLALAEMRVVNASGENVALRRDVTASDSTEDSEWGKAQLTDETLRITDTQRIAPMFRHEFDIDKPVRRAKAYVAGLGYYEFHLNGRRIGDRVLDPGYTDYQKRVLYSTYDVTDALAPGKNAAGAIVGKGWFTGSPCILAQVHIDFEDGTRQIVATNGNWKLGRSPLTQHSIYQGEAYDARREQRGWAEPGFDDASWESAVVIASPTQKLSAQAIQPIRVIETLKPISISNPIESIWVYDFGQNVSGWCRLTVSGPRGTQVSLKFAELAYADGTVNQENLRTAGCMDRYILRGDDIECYEPRFTYHGFRYVQIEGYPGEPDFDSLLGFVVHTDVKRCAAFQSSNSLLNQIQTNSLWSFRTNLHSIPTDCPQRDERQGWLGDAHMTADMGLYNFDIAAVYNKYLRDIRDAQQENGSIPDTVPYIWGGNPGDPLFSSGYLQIAGDLYRHTGDVRIIEEHYSSFKRYINWMAGEAHDYVISTSHYGDWTAPVETPKPIVSTGCFYLVASMMSVFAGILGELEDREYYKSLCEKIADAFNAEFFNSDAGCYGNKSQFSNAWPLYLGIVPPDKCDAVVASLARDIEVNHRGHLSTGFMGTRYLLDALCSVGRFDLAFGIVCQNDCPGWGYMIANGATTLWELWKLECGSGMNSHNHAAYGFVSGWFYRALAGIAPNIDYPGFERFDIKPHIVDGEWEAEASVETLRGRITSHVRSNEDGVTLTTTIPANTRATVWVPLTDFSSSIVREGDAVAWDDGFVPGVDGILCAFDDGRWIRFEVGSGSYVFSCSKARSLTGGTDTVSIERAYAGV